MRVVIATVATAYLSTHFHTSMNALLLTPNHCVDNVFTNIGGVNLDHRRNVLVRDFLSKTKADVLMFIDSDMTFEPDAIGRLLEHVDPKTRPVVGGLAFVVSQKGPKVFCSPTIYRRRDLWGDVFVRQRGYKHVHSFEENTLMRVDGTGAACLMIHRSVFEKIPEPWFFYTNIEDERYGEDLYFCDKLREHDIPLYVHTGIEFGHHKSMIVGKEEFYGSKSEAD